MYPIVVDLGVGLGGASAAFKEAGFEVVGVDIDRKGYMASSVHRSRAPCSPNTTYWLTMSPRKTTSEQSAGAATA